MAKKDLDAAFRALTKGRLEEGVDALARAFHACRAAPILELMNQVTARLGDRPPIKGKNADARFKAWMAVAELRQQVDLDRLVAALPTLAYDDDKTAMDLLLYDWPPNPRMGALLDHALLGWARASYLRDRIDDLRRVHTGSDGTLTEAALAVVGSIARLYESDLTGEEALRRIYEDPLEAGPRLVYADWLQERGDPRGELIALQFAGESRPLTPAERKREKDLLKAHGEKWVLPLLSIRPGMLQMGGTRFERGFLAACPLGGLHAEGLACPLWSTVRALDLEMLSLAPRLDHALLLHPVWRSLREVTGIGRETLDRLISLRRRAGLPLPFDAIGYSGAGPFDHGERPLLEDGDMFAHLRTLGVRGPFDPPAYRWLWDTATGQRLERLTIGVGVIVVPPLVEWVAESPRLPASLRTIELTARHRMSVALTRPAGGAFSAMHVRFAQFTAAGDQPTLVRAALAPLPPGTVTRLSVAVRGRLTRAVVAQVEAAARDSGQAPEQIEVWESLD